MSTIMHTLFDIGQVRLTGSRAQTGGRHITGGSPIESWFLGTSKLFHFFQ